MQFLSILGLLPNLRPLPVSLPLTRNGMRQSEAKCPLGQRAVVLAAVILQPCRMRGVGVQVLRRDEVMLATDHAPQASEVGLGLIGANAVLAERFRVVDALHLELRFKRVPVARLVGVKGCVLGENGCHGSHAVGLLHDHERARVALLLANYNDRSALAGLVFLETTVLAVLGLVLRPVRAANPGTVNFDSAGQQQNLALGGQSLAQKTEKNLNNKIARGGFTAAFFVLCLTAVGAHSVRLED